MEAALARHVDRADPPREGAGHRCGQEAHDEGEPERKEAVGQVGHRHGHASRDIV